MARKGVNVELGAGEVAIALDRAGDSENWHWGTVD
jgi:hypothetical protein